MYSGSLQSRIAENVKENFHTKIEQNQKTKKTPTKPKLWGWLKSFCFLVLQCVFGFGPIPIQKMVFQPKTKKTWKKMVFQPKTNNNTWKKIVFQPKKTWKEMVLQPKPQKHGKRWFFNQEQKKHGKRWSNQKPKNTWKKLVWDQTHQQNTL